MNSTSLSPSSLSRNWKHHVFLSFHGGDVRKAFLSHILKEFRSKGIDPFIDNDIEKSKSIGPELIEAIKGSRIAIVLLSRNYASSTWCLDELVEIMKGREDLGQIVVTTFYEVDPTDVKKQTGSFGDIFRKTCKDKTKEVIDTWRQALAAVATITGYHSSNWDTEATMIEKLATDISNKLNFSTRSSDFNSFIGMRAHFRKMEPLLCLDSDEVRIIGIWGPSGIGKTAIARFLLNQLSQQFQFSTIIVNIKVSYPRPCHDEYSSSMQLQKQLLSQLLNQKDIEIPHLGIVEERLKDKKVLVILDDVDRLVQLQAMANQPQWFGLGSRIVITTQNLKTLKAHGINHIYKVDFPSNHEALEIFCMYAFGQKSPYDGFEVLAWEITELSCKLPLGLRVMGSYLRKMSKEEWTRALPGLRTRLDGEIESILTFSYDALSDENKDLFLHIACFFSWSSMRTLVEYLAKIFLDIREGLHVLADKSLIFMNDSGEIYMHGLLAKLGREIVRKEFVYEPGKRKFLINPTDICDVLTDDTGSRKVLGIDLKVFEIEDELDISEKAFDGMSNLQFLRFSDDFIPHNKLNLSHGLNSLPRKLRLLHWMHFPMICFPSKFHTQFLVELNMQCSKLERLWEGIRPLGNLKWMNLSYSRNLRELPDLSTATSLHELFLLECSSLEQLPSTIGHATNLKGLNLMGCSSLVELPTSIGNATSLMYLDLDQCSSLVELPSIGITTNLKHLRRLAVNNCKKLVSIPQLLNFLCKLDAQDCESLEKLDCSFHNPEISLSFAKCFKLNGEARDLIIQTSLIHGVAILPGGEVPSNFTYRAIGDSVALKLNERPLPTSVRFKACILLVYKGDDDNAGEGELIEISSRIIDKQNGINVTCRPDDNLLYPPITKHLYIFEAQAEEVINSREFVVEFKVDSWEIVECGVLEPF